MCFRQRERYGTFHRGKKYQFKNIRVRKQKLKEKGATKSRGNPENPSDELQRRRDALEKRKQDGRWKV